MPPSLSTKTKADDRSSARRRSASPAAASAFAPALAALEAGDIKGARARLLACRREVAKSDVAANLLAYLHLRLERHAEAVAWFDIALGLRAGHAEALAGRGLALHGTGRSRDAVASYDAALALRAGDPETLHNRGVALEECEEWEAALRSYEDAVALRPDYHAPLMRRAALLERLGRLDEALAAAEDAVRRLPADAGSIRACGNILLKLGRAGPAALCYEEALRRQPGLEAVHANRGAALQRLGRLDEALQAVEQALERDGPNAETFILQGNILKESRRQAEAETAFRKAVAIRPLKPYPAARKQADFNALLVYSPACSNTPYEDLISASPFACDLMFLMEDLRYDRADLEARCDIVFNLVSDADCGQPALALAQDFLSPFRLPVVNPPDKVRRTDRRSVSELLSGLPGAIVPRVRRMTAAELGRAGGLAYPLIVRAVGTHGGDEMELVHDPAGLDALAGGADHAEYYVANYIDYRSADGHFRKYRFMFVGGETLPYHLAIGDRWKVHHATTSMTGHPWMQDEERRFLEDPGAVFPASARQTLAAIRDAIGIDYFGIDCALAPDGRVVVFETNASMLVHLHNEGFPYKNEHVLRIKRAFEAMMRDKIAAHRALRS